MFVCNRAYLELLENYIFLDFSMCPSKKARDVLKGTVDRNHHPISSFSAKLDHTCM